MPRVPKDRLDGWMGQEDKGAVKDVPGRAACPASGYLCLSHTAQDTGVPSKAPPREGLQPGLGSGGEGDTIGHRLWR